MPLAVGIVGGIASVYPMAKIGLKTLQVSSAQELGMVIVAVGLAQNIAALRALADEGIQKGHMKLHSRNIAISAGATGPLIDLVAEKMSNQSNISIRKCSENIRRSLRQVLKSFSQSQRNQMYRIGLFNWRPPRLFNFWSDNSAK